MVSKGFDVIAVSANGKEIPEIVDFEGVEHKVFNLTRSITPFTDLLTIVKLTHYVRKERIDIIHTHTPKAGLIGLMAGYLAGVKVRLHTIAGIPWMESHGFKRLILKHVDKFIYRFASRVYSNSEKLKTFILDEKLVRAYKLKVLGNGSSNGIDTAYFDPDQVKFSKKELRCQLNIPETAFVFIFVGRVVKDKGMNELARAFTKLPKTAHLVLVGPLEQDLDPLADETLKFFQEDSKVHLLGYQNDVRPFLKLADALVFPSYREGFPNVPLQAGAFGLPSIVTDINGCNEIVVDRQNGLVIPVKDEDALKSAMELLINDKVLVEQMKARSRQMIVNRYAQKVVWEALYTEYRRLSKEKLHV